MNEPFSAHLAPSHRAVAQDAQISRDAKGSTAVRAAKRPKLSEGEAWQKLELFPTPPWATRALCEIVLPRLGVYPSLKTVLEPAAGLGHMSEVLGEYAECVEASDVYDYAVMGAAKPAIRRADFLDPASPMPEAEWVITNPPFSPAQDFLCRAMTLAHDGIALLLRMQWLESETRYTRVFLDRPPALVAQFSERVPMCEGGWDPQLSSATAYAWFVWLRHGAGWASALRAPGRLDLFLIPPGQRDRLTRTGDALLATRHVPGWIAPSTLKKSGRDQLMLGPIGEVQA